MLYGINFPKYRTINIYNECNTPHFETIFFKRYFEFIILIMFIYSFIKGISKKFYNNNNQSVSKALI